MSNRVRRDLKDIFFAVRNVLGWSKFFFAFSALFFLIYFVIPKNSALNSWVNLKNSVQIHFNENISFMRSKIFAKASIEQQLDIALAKNLRLEHKLKAQELQLAEYRQLQGLLNFTPLGHKFYTAKVLKMYNNSFNNSMHITGGLGKYSIGNLVLNTSGVVGTISEVFETYSIVTLYTHPTFKIPVKGISTNNRYILTGTGKNGIMHLNYVNNAVVSIEEEELVTSGEGGKFAAGLSVGILTHKNDVYVVYKHSNFAANPFVMVLQD